MKFLTLMLLYHAQRSSLLPWGKGGATLDAVYALREMNTGRPFHVDLAKIAPTDWDHKRVLLSFILQNDGRGSQARFLLSPAK